MKNRKYMSLKIFKFIMLAAATTSLSLLSASNSYSSPPQANNHGPVQYGHPSSFGMPRANPTFGSHGPHPHGTNNPHAFVTQPANRANNHFHHNSFTVPYIINGYGSSYYVTQPDDDSYDYTTTATDTSNDNSVSQPTSFNLPEGQWTSSSNGNVPDQSIVYQTVNGQSTYYCRAQYQNQFTYGVLTPNEGCYINNQSNLVYFNTYDVLTAN
jgi:hypothetical protein